MSHLRSRLVFIAGIAILGMAAVPGSAIESFLGRTPGSLAWGPMLFRALLVFHGLLLIVASRVGGSGARQRKPVFTSADPLLPLSAITVAALILRLWRLDTSLWLDEILTMVDFVRMPLGYILTSFPNQNQHMLFSILGHASTRMFGESAWALRLPSVLFGVASIWALYLLARKLLSVREAVFAALLMAFSYHHIWFSQNGRGYTGVLLFSILSTWLWLEAMESGNRRVWAAYGVVLFLGMWIHMTILFVMAAHGLIWLADCLRQRRIIREPPAAWLLCLTLTAQAIALALPEFFRSALGEVSMQSEWTNPLWVVRETFRSLSIGFAGTAVVICGALFVFAGWAGIVRRNVRAGFAMVLPAVIGGGAMLALGHNLWPRFFFFSMGFALLIVVHGAAVLPGALRIPRPYRASAAAAVTLLIVAASAVTIPRCYALPKQDFTGARDFVENRRTPGDEVVVVGLAVHAYRRYYAPSWTVIETPEQLQALRARAARVLLVFTLPIELEAFHPDLWRSVNADFRKIAVFPGTLGGGEVFVCENRWAHGAMGHGAMGMSGSEAPRAGTSR